MTEIYHVLQGNCFSHDAWTATLDFRKEQICPWPRVQGDLVLRTAMPDCNNEDTLQLYTSRPDVPGLHPPLCRSILADLASCTQRSTQATKQGDGQGMAES
jgi:hypothetical protein